MPESGPALPKGERAKKWAWLPLVLGAALIIESAWLAWLIITKKENSFLGLIPQNSIAVISFKQESVLANFKKLKKEEYSLPPFSWLADFTKNIVQNNNLNAIETKLKQAFENEMTAALLDNQGIPPKWMVFAKVKLNSSEFISQLDQLEKNLELRYNLISELYRQTKITRAKHLNGNPNDTYYVYIKSYFIISNSPETIKKTINKIMDL